MQKRRKEDKLNSFLNVRLKERRKKVIYSLLNVLSFIKFLCQMNMCNYCSLFLIQPFFFCFPIFYVEEFLFFHNITGVISFNSQLI